MVSAVNLLNSLSVVWTLSKITHLPTLKLQWTWLSRFFRNVIASEQDFIRQWLISRGTSSMKVGINRWKEWNRCKCNAFFDEFIAMLWYNNTVVHQDNSNKISEMRTSDNRWYIQLIQTFNITNYYKAFYTYIMAYPITGISVMIDKYHILWKCDPNFPTMQKHTAPYWKHEFLSNEEKCDEKMLHEIDKMDQYWLKVRLWNAYYLSSHSVKFFHSCAVIWPSMSGQNLLHWQCASILLGKNDSWCYMHKG